MTDLREQPVLTVHPVNDGVDCAVFFGDVTRITLDGETPVEFYVKTITIDEDNVVRKVFAPLDPIGGGT